eukprot:jgi/Mesvir1/2097/Mv16629-RA.1
MTGHTYTEAEVAEVFAYLERMKTWPVNYYTNLKGNFGKIFANTNYVIPDSVKDLDFSVDFGTLDSARYPPRMVEDALRIEGVRMYRRTQRDRQLEDIRKEYDAATLAAENQLWWLAHCQALRDGANKNTVFVIDGVEEEYSGITVLTNEYTDNLKYFTKDSLYDTVGNPNTVSATPSANGLAGFWSGRKEGTSYEASWWALLSNPRVKMTWPRVIVHGEEVSFDWCCFDVNTHEVTAYGDVIFFRCGDKGAAYKKYEHLYFLRDCYAPFFNAYFNSIKK